MAQSYKITVSAGVDRAAEFVTWLNKQGHAAMLSPGIETTWQGHDVYGTTNAEMRAWSVLVGLYDEFGAEEDKKPDPLFTPCCANERRSMNGGCLSCGDPCF